MPFTPVSDDNHHFITPMITYAFVLINLAVLVFSMFLQPEPLALFFKYLGTVPAELWGHVEPAGVIPEKVTLLTSAIIHSGPEHFIFNMLFFLIFADNIEYAFGDMRYILFCIAAAIVSSLGCAFVNADSTIPGIGFSGVVSAILGAYMVLYPHAKVNLLTPAELLFFARGFDLTFKLPAWLIMGAWFSQDLIGLFMVERHSTGGGVGFSAHVAGFVFGMLTARLLRVNYSPYELGEWKREQGRTLGQRIRRRKPKAPRPHESAAPPAEDNKPKKGDMWGHD